jgi:hypothetical protein
MKIKVQEYLEREGKRQIVQALQRVRIDAGFLVPNKCAECDYRISMTRTVKCTTGDIVVKDYGCELDDRIFNTYGCDKDLLGQHGEPLSDRCVDDDYMEDYDTSYESHLRQIGELKL